MKPAALDAATLAERMNARPMAEGEEGGEWYAVLAGGGGLQCGPCGGCMAAFTEPFVSCDIGGGAMHLCLPCALAECERAEGEALQRERAAAYTANDLPRALAAHREHMRRVRAASAAHLNARRED